MEAFNDLNPWWFLSNWEVKDKHLSEWERQGYRWVPRWINEISLEPFSLNFVYGIRQAGKTTGIKLLIRELIRRGVDPLSIYYLDLDYVASFAELRRALEWLSAEIKKRGNRTSYVFLDEVTAIEEWWRALKFFLDKGEFRDSVITVSGSSSVNLVKAPERFPGRKGRGREVPVMPLSFPEFAEVRSGKSREELLSDVSLARSLFRDYLEVGGFPKSVNNHPDAYDAIISGIVGETYKAGKRLEIVQEVLGSIITKVPSAFSYNSIANDVGVSHNTVAEYVDFLADIFVIGVAYLKRGNEVVKRKEKKVFFRDPFLLRAIAKWLGREFEGSAILEGVVQEHLYRKFGEVYYYKDSYEVDVVAGDLKVEVKKSRSRKSYPEGVTVVDEENAPLFLLEL